MKAQKKRTWKALATAAILAAMSLILVGCDGSTSTGETDTAEDDSIVAETVAETTTSTTEAVTTTKAAQTTTVTETDAKETETTVETTVTEKTTATTKTEAQAAQVAQKVTTTKAKTTTQAAKTTAKTTTTAKSGHYETVHHEAVTKQVWVEDVAATTKKIFECYCGEQFSSVDEYIVHDKTLSMNGDEEHCCGKYNGYRFWDETVEAQGHYETQVVTAAYDEQVWVED